MPNPEVRYCTTEDGVRIAYTVTGSGPPLVLRMDPIASHVQLEWSIPTFARAFGRLARANTLIRFDQRGSGMSDRVPAATSMDSTLDTKAVVDGLQLDRFAFAAVQGASLSAICYVAQHPERVHHVVLIDGFLRFSDLLNTPQVRAILSAAGSDFVLATESISAAVFGPGHEETLKHGAFIRSCIGPEYFGLAANVAADDATADALALTMPVLVMRHEGLQYVTAEMTRDLVSRLPDARLVVTPGLWGDDPERLADRLTAFINDQEYEEPSAAIVEGAQSPFRTVVFTDLVGHTQMMHRLGDTKGRDVLREHERITREALLAHGGAEVKTMGDGFMASFGSVTKAVECAIALQRAFEAWNAQGEHAGSPLQVRVGLNAGEPIAEEGDLFGSTVILASRIAAHAGAGEILIPDTVRGLLSGKSFLYSDRGHAVLKGFEDPVRLYEVRWRESPP